MDAEESKRENEKETDLFDISSFCDLKEKALQEALKRENALKTVINNSPVVVFIWKNEKNWPTEFVSENVIQFGYTVDDFISMRFLYGDIVHPEDLYKVNEELEKRIREGYVDFNMEYRIITKARDVRWVNERTFIQRDQNGNVTHYQGVILDVTDRVESEIALQKALEVQKMLRTIINNSPAVAFLWEKDKNWPAEFVSENISQFGYTVDDFLSKKILYGDIIHPDDLNKVKEELERCIKAGTADFKMEYRIITKDRKMRWVDARVFIQRDQEGNITNYQGIVLDISERKENEKMLDIQKELGLTLTSTMNLNRMLNEVLDACFQINAIDSGGIYFVDELTDQIKLVIQKGLSSEFVEKVSVFKQESFEASMIMSQKPVYDLDFYSEGFKEILRLEGLKAVAVIPLRYRGDIIGSLNLASHTEDEVPGYIRTGLETIAMHAVNYIAPIRIEVELV